MCGIVGLFAFNERGRTHQAHLSAACASLAARGPNNTGIYQDHCVGIGHRRLSVLDPRPEAHQPMKRGRYVLTFNGEIYNYKRLRHQLQQKGYSFSTHSDTEVLLQGYVAWGEQVLEHLEGFFAFCLYDKHTQSIFLARDRLGIKPLYYSLDENRLLFGSEVKALQALGVRKELDSVALYTYLQLGYIPAPRSILQEVKKLPAGYAMSVKNKQHSSWSYYQIPSPTQSATVKGTLFNTLEQAVKDRLQTDVPLGAFLSGGLDSSIIVGLAARHKSDLQTFSIGYKDNRFFDESNYAALAAKHFGTRHHLFSLSEDDLLEDVNSAVDYLDEPFGDSSALPSYILSKRTCKSVKVALSGDGADELFAGYTKHKAWVRSCAGHKLDKRIALGRPLWQRLPKSRHSRLPNTIRQLFRYSTALQLPPAERYWYLSSLQQEDQAMALLHPTQRQKINGTYTDYKSTYLPIERNWQDLNQVLAADVSLVLAGDMLTKVDRMSMAHGLEVRVPFLDKKMVAAAFALPVEQKINPKEGQKAILRSTFSSLLPEALLRRPKHGFEVPLLQWMRTKLNGELTEWVFNRERIEDQGLLNWPQLAKLKATLHSNNPHDAATHTWCLYVLQRFMAKL